jgi:serine/threonine protein kinase
VDRRGARAWAAIVGEVVSQTRRGSLVPGTRVGRYELLRRLARGGMAELYLARASGLHGFEKLCVVKLVLPHLVEDRRFVQMFLHEARMAATLDHPNIAQVTDIGELEGEPFFVMQYVRGRDLRKIAKALRGAPLPLDVALTVASQVAAGLHYVHESKGPEGKSLGLVHRDVSPANVMIGFDGDVKLVDFGIAKSVEQSDATRTGVIKGKVSYMSPEQCRGDAIDRRTDIFALGILLCEMTTGRRLFRGDTDFAIMSKIVDGRFPAPHEGRPEYPEALEAIVLRALRNDPEDRYPNTAEMQRELESFAQDQGLRLSSLTLSSFMRELFGEQPNAAGVDPLDESPTEIRPVSARPTVVEASDTEAGTIALPDTAAATLALTEAPEEPRAGWTIVAPPPPEPRRETVVIAAELDDDPPLPHARRGWWIGVAAAIGVGAIVIAAFATSGDAPPRTESSPAGKSAPAKPTIAQDPAPPPERSEPPPDPEPEPEPEPASDPADVAPKPAIKVPRGQRPRPRANPKAKSGKRGSGLDEMYPSG